MSHSSIRTAMFFLSLALAPSLSASLFADSLPERRGERIDRHLDAKGERIDRRLDRRAAVADANGHPVRAQRLDAKGDRIENRLDARGDRIRSRLEARAARRTN
jgi:hypothetical protein